MSMGITLINENYARRGIRTLPARHDASGARVTAVRVLAQLVRGGKTHASFVRTSARG